MKFKRGIVSLQLNWIFIIIAGSIVLVIFSGIVIKQNNLSKTSENVLILKNLGTILSSYETNAGSVNVLKLPAVEIEFSCDGYSIEGISKQFNGMNVFAPKSLDSSNIISMTLGWNIPYRISNFVYLANPNVRYAFVTSDDFGKTIFGMIPDEMTKDIYSNRDLITDKNDDILRLVFFDEITIPEIFKDKKSLTALKIDGNADKGSVEFYEIVDNELVSKGISHYIGEETLLGAIFSEDVDMYGCIMQDAFEKLNLVSQVYERKTNNLRLSYIGHKCESFYDPGSINSIIESSFEFNELGIESINTAAKNLERQNEQMQLLSCPLIY